MSHDAGAALLTQIRKNKASWVLRERLTQQTIYWQGFSDWPRPDIAFQDSRTKSTIAIEFKPPGQAKREYITGIGQAFAYLKDFEFSALIVPLKTEDGFDIANYIKSCLEQDYATMIPIALFAYKKDPAYNNDLIPLIELRPRSHPPTSKQGKRRVE